jgi:FixJ family two-component response regulator
VTQRRPSRPIDAPETPVVLVVDDDPSLREALGRLFRSVDLESKLFPSVAELLMNKFPDVPCCLVLDIRLPGVSGLDFQTQLANSNIHVPIIMMTCHGDIPMSVRAMKGGAVDFLTKPFRRRTLAGVTIKSLSPISR